MAGVESNKEPRTINRDQLLTVGDLEQFKADLLTEIQAIIARIEQPKEWLRSKEVRKLLNISPGTLQNFRINGTLSYSKLDKVIYYKSAEITDLLQRNLVNAND